MGYDYHQTRLTIVRLLSEDHGEQERIDDEIEAQLATWMVILSGMPNTVNPYHATALSQPGVYPDTP